MNFEIENGILKKYTEDLTERGKDIVLPEGIQSIGEKAFYHASIKSVTLPEGLISIGESAFNWCGNLQSVYFPQSIKSIGKSAFSGCSKLEEVHFADIMSWLNIEIEDEWNNAFSAGRHWKLFVNGSLVEDLSIPRGISKITNWAFAHCCSIKTVIIPEGVVELGRGAFNSCDNLIEISLPESLHTVGMHAINSFHLRKINIKSIEAWLQIDFNNEEHNYPFDFRYTSDNDISICIDGKPIECLRIPQGIKEIGDLRFQGLTCIKEAILPEGLVSIGENAFAGCQNLQTISIPNSVQSISQGAFQSCRSIKSIKLPNGLTSINNGLFFGCSGLESIDIPSSINEIKRAAFHGCKSLKTIQLPNSVTIGENAFEMSGITKIELPEGIEVIEREVFSQCYSLERIKLPSSLKKICSGAFHSCNGIKEVHIPDLTTWMNIDFEDNPLGGDMGIFGRSGGNLIVNGEKITSLNLPLPVSAIGDSWFSGCAGFTELIIPEGIECVGRLAFIRCPNLEKVVFPSTMKTISDYAFAYCPKLKGISIPKGVISIGNSAFCGCNELVEVVLPSMLSQINQNVFNGCIGLKTIDIPDSVNTIGRASFSKSGLVKLVIPDGVVKIDEEAFSQCGQLQEVYIPATVSSISSNAFAQCSALNKVVIECNFNAISKDAFTKCSAVKEVYIMEDQFEVARDYFLKKVRFYTIDGTKLGKPENKGASNSSKKTATKTNKQSVTAKKGGNSMETKVIYPDGASVSPVTDVILYNKDKPKGFVKPEIKEASVVLEGKEFNAIFKIASKLPSIWKRFYTEKENGGIYDPDTALKAAQQSDGFIDDSTGSYVSCPLYGQIPESTQSLTPNEIESRLKAFVLIANQCIEEKTLLKIANALPKKKNGMLHKGRLVHITYLDLVDYDGSTYEIVAKNEDDSQFCVEIRSNVPVVSDLFYQSYLL